MCKKFTPEELNSMQSAEKDEVIYSMQDRLDALEKNYEHLMEQIRIADQHRFGRHTEKLDQIAGQLSFFNEAEDACDLSLQEPGIDEIIPVLASATKKKKQKGKREEDLKDLPQEEFTHDISSEQLNECFGTDCWKEMPDEVCWQLRFEPSRWIAEKHIIKVYVGTDGDHQDEFLRGDHPKTMFHGSIATPSIVSAAVNAKYVNASPIERICRDFQTNGLNLSKQTVSNWLVNTSERYLSPVYVRMKDALLAVHVNQCDETPVEVVNDGRSAGSKSYMWVHITGELSTGPKVVLYEYQKTRSSDHPKAFYKDFKGILVTDGLEQYHKTARETEGLVNANCWAHARRDYVNAIKAMNKDNPEAIKRSTAYQALARIGAIYKLEEGLKALSPKERLKERQSSIRPLVEEYFTWIKKVLFSVPPKSKTADGIRYSINQEEYLRVFLTDGEVAIDNSASERALRDFTIGRKNWVTINTPRGAEASAVIYSITQTAKLNGLNVYYYIKYLLEQLVLLKDEDGNIEQSALEPLMPWSKTLPADCYSKRRQ